MNITFIASIGGVILMILRRLPEATSMEKHQHRGVESEVKTQAAGSALFAKGLPIKAYSKSKVFFKLVGHKIGQFLLEAKGLKQSPKISYNFQKVFSKLKADTAAPIIQDEKYYINLIKRNPKDNSYYDLLGQYYLEEKKMDDALNVYEYLVSHAPTETTYWVRLGLAALFVQDFTKAEYAYQKALKLDPTNPSRFYNLALAQQGLKKYDLAHAAMQKALELDPNNQKYRDFKFEMETKAKTTVPLENIHKTE